MCVKFEVSNTNNTGVTDINVKKIKKIREQICLPKRNFETDFQLHRNILCIDK